MVSRDDFKNSVLPWALLKLVFSFRNSIVLLVDFSRLKPSGFLALVRKPEVVYQPYPFVWGADAWLFYP